ncbi:hypothetical protein [Streptomyces sp. NPDC053431]|uniref:hypothetical protein n=1 Tax=Streptomyces sp. NPDC053431 TaxID=3365703 RepID=UPI0037D3451C
MGEQAGDSLDRVADVLAAAEVAGQCPPVLEVGDAVLNGSLWHERHQAKLASRPPKREGAGAKDRLVFVDRLLATLGYLRPGVTLLDCWVDVDRSTITRAIGEVRPLLDERGCTVSLGARLRTLAEVMDHLGASADPRWVQQSHRRTGP